MLCSVKAESTEALNVPCFVLLLNAALLQSLCKQEDS